MIEANSDGYGISPTHQLCTKILVGYFVIIFYSHHQELTADHRQSHVVVKGSGTILSQFPRNAHSAGEYRQLMSPMSSQPRLDMKLYKHSGHTFYSIQDILLQRNSYTAVSQKLIQTYPKLKDQTWIPLDVWGKGVRAVMFRWLNLRLLYIIITVSTLRGREGGGGGELTSHKIV